MARFRTLRSNYLRLARTLARDGIDLDNSSFEPINSQRRDNAGEQLVPVAKAIVKKASVTPGQVVRYLSDIASANRHPPPTHGFPVQPVPRASTAPIPVEPLPPLEQ